MTKLLWSNRLWGSTPCHPSRQYDFLLTTRCVGRKPLRLDNTGAWVIEVFPSLLCNQMSEHVDPYIKLKLGIFSFI